MGRDILLGVVVGAQGLRGEVKVKTFTETPEALARYGALHTKDGRALRIASLRVAKGDVAVVAFTGVNSREAAEALKGAELFVARAAFPAPDDGEYYHADLIGLEAADESGRALGTVSAIHNFGAGDVIELTRPDGDHVHLPFTSETVPHIDIAQGIITIVIPRDDEAEKQGFVE